MFFTLEAALGVAIFVGVFLFVFSFFIRNKVIKKILLFFTGVIFILCVSIFLSHENFLNRTEESLVGTYIIDVRTSDLNGYSSEYFSDLELLIKDDKSFRFSKDVPFLKKESGKWSYYDDGDIWYLELTFSEVGSIQGAFDENTILLEHLIPEVNEKAVKVLEFKRR